MGISRPQGLRSAPAHPAMVAKSSTGAFHQPEIMMDQCASESVQKLCMLVCQKIIRPRLPKDNKTSASPENPQISHLGSTFVSFNTAIAFI